MPGDLGNLRPQIGILCRIELNMAVTSDTERMVLALVHLRVGFRSRSFDGISLAFALFGLSMRMGPSSSHATRTIIEMAESQYGVVSRRQLLAKGVSRGVIQSRQCSGWLSSIYPGTYAVGHTRLTMRGQWMAAVLACGPGASLSHRTAASLWGLAPPPPQIDIMRTTSSASDPPRYGGRPAPFGRPIEFHRSRRTGIHEFEVHDRIPVTSVPRTFLDLASLWSVRQLDSALSEAERNGLVRMSQFRKITERGRGWTGIAKLREVVDGWDPELLRTKSELEARFRNLCRDHGIPSPEVNVLVGGFEVDCLWRQQRLIVELDGARFHRSPGQLHEDKERTAALEDLGFRVLRLSWRMVEQESSTAAARVRRRLARSVLNRT